MGEESKETQEAKPEIPSEEQIGRMNKASERLEAANKKFEENRLLMAEEKLNKELGGQGEAGAPPPKKSPETPEEYKDKVLRGDV